MCVQLEAAAVVTGCNRGVIAVPERAGPIATTTPIRSDGSHSGLSPLNKCGRQLPPADGPSHIRGRCCLFDDQYRYARMIVCSTVLPAVSAAVARRETKPCPIGCLTPAPP